MTYSIKELGWKQAEIGKRLGITQPNVSMPLNYKLDNFSSEKLMPLHRSRMSAAACLSGLGLCMLLTSCLANAAAKVTLAVNAFFASGSAATGRANQLQLQEFACRLARFEIEIVIAVGHADARERNAEALAKARAVAVQRVLIENGLDRKKTYQEGKAAKQPIASNFTKHGRAKNRRVEVEAVPGQFLGVGGKTSRSCNPITAAIDDDDVLTLKKLSAFAPYMTHSMVWSPAVEHAIRKDKKAAIAFLTGKNFFARLDPSERAGILEVLVRTLRFDLLTKLPPRYARPGNFPKGFDPFSYLICLEPPKEKVADEILAWLIEHGHRIRGHNQSALKCAIAAADRPMVVRLLELGADLNETDKQYAPAVFSSPGDVEFLAWLASLGAKFGAVTENGGTALHHIEIKSPQVLEWLLQQGIDINSRSAELGANPLTAQIHRLSREMVLEMVRRGADISNQDNSGATPLVLAIRYGNTGAIRALVDAGVDCRQLLGPERRTLLHAVIAARASVRNLLETLERCGVDVLATDAQGNSALHLAVRHGDAETLRLLARLAYSSNAKNAMGDTPLHIAASRAVKVGAYVSVGPSPRPYVVARLVEEKLAMVNILIAAGADRASLDAASRTAVQRIADSEGQEEIVEMLRIPDSKKMP